MLFASTKNMTINFSITIDQYLYLLLTVSHNIIDHVILYVHIYIFFLLGPIMAIV